MNSPIRFYGMIAATCLLLTACNYDFPLTTQPTGPIEPALLGDWVSFDKDDQKLMHLNVRKLDATTYVVALDGDLYRAFHSDFAGLPLLSVQSLQPGREAGKYVYYRYVLAPDGESLRLAGVSTKVVPAETKSPGEAQRLISANLTNPKLFVDELEFTRKKSR